MVPFWGRSPLILVYVSGDWDVRDFDPWPHWDFAESFDGVVSSCCVGVVQLTG